jgi:hypothetical protein
MNSRHARTLTDIFAKPTRANITWNALVGLLEAVGAELDTARAGSRVSIALKGERITLHKPHPGSELRKYQVEEVRGLFQRVGIAPPE